MPGSFNTDILISMKEAQKIILSSFHHTSQTRIIPVKDAKGYILAEPVFSQRTIPPLPLAGIDGIAIRSKETKGASEKRPRQIDGIKVNVGLPMPEGYDAVVPDKEIQVKGPDHWVISSVVFPHYNVIKKGVGCNERSDGYPKRPIYHPL